MNNRDYLILTMQNYDYPEAARATFMDAYDRICGETEYKERFEALLQQYAENADCDYEAILEDITALSEKADVHPYTGTLVLYLCMSRHMKEHYLRRGYTVTMWEDMMQDFWCKIKECKSVHNIWGIFALKWFFNAFSMKRFAFCRLQFELGGLGLPYEDHGILLTPESKIVHVHIPGGSPLDVESKDKSYRLAAEFYKDEFQGGPVIFTCNSWLLYPRNREILKPTSNIIAFMNDYHEMYSTLYSDYSSVWRIFGMQYDGDVDKLPVNNSLQRAYADWIRKGEPIGSARGVFAYCL